MPIPFLNSIKLNKNQVEDFCVFNYSGDPTLSSGADFGYLWLNTSATPKVLKFWDGTNYRTLIDSTTISSSTAGTANDLSGGVAGSLPYQQGVGDTTFLGIGSSGYILTSTGSAPQWSASIPSTSVSGLAASATTDTTNASNISSGTLGLARLSLATDQFYVGDASNNPAATAKSSIPLSGFGAAGADVAMGGFKITGLGTPTASTDAANKDYVDSVAQGLDVKASCLVATTTDITLASPGAVTIDGIYSATDFTAGTTRILVKDQSASAENGIYIWQGPAAAMTRSADANTWDELVGAFTFVERGTANADSGWVCTVNAGGTLGSTAVTWVKFSQAGSYTQGRGMVLDGTAFNFAQNTDYTAGRIPFASGPTTIGFNANLHWDNFNNRLGIGTATPGYTLDVNGNLSLSGVSGGSRYILLGAETSSYTGSLIIQAGAGSAAYGGGIVLYGHSHATYPGGVWIGRSGSATGPIMFGDYGTGPGNKFLQLDTGGVCTWYDGAGGTRMTLNGNGLGIGGGPVAPDGASRTFQIGSSTVIQTPVGEQTSFSNNTYYDGTGWKRIVANRFCNSIRFNGLGNTGDITFSCAGTGAAGSALTNWDTSDVKMVLNYLGNLGIGTKTPGTRLTVADASPTIRLNDTNTSVAGGVFGTIDWLSQDSSMPGGLAAKIDVYDDLGGYGDRGAIRFFTNNGTSLGERMVLTSSGNLGLGVTPASWAGGKAIQTGTATADASLSGLGDDTNIATNAYYNAGWKYINGGYTAARYRQSGGVHSWFTATAGGSNGAAISDFTSAKMTLDPSGRLLVGTASARSNFFNSSVTTQLQVEGDGAASFVRNVNDVYGGVLVLGKIRGASIVQNNDRVSQISFQGSDGTEFVECANISAEIDGAPGANDMPGRLVFSTTSDGAAAPTERLRIKSTGQVNFVGQASDPAGAAGDVVYNSTSNRLKYHNGTAWVNTGTNKYSGALAGTGTSFTVTHNLGTRDVTVAVRKSGSTYDQVFTDVQMTDTNTVTIVFASSVTGSDYTVTVIG